MWVNNYYPIATTMGLIKCDIDAVSNAYQKWMNRVFSATGIYVESCEVEGTFDSIITRLLPLTTPIPTRSVFIKTHSEWVVYFDNFRIGTDPASTVYVLSNELKCVSRLIIAVPPPISKNDSDFRYPGNRIDYYDENGNCTRHIYAINDGGSWRFGQKGDPFPFEEVECYSAKKKKDRLTTDIMVRYLAHEGLYPFNLDWYSQRALLFTKKGGYIPKGIVEYPLPKNATN